MSANKYQTNLERMRELIRILNKADIAYYRDDNPIMTDFDYDKLFDELKGLERDTKLILSNSPTQKVSGEILDELTKVRHSKPMLSADKTKSVAELARFAADRDVILSWKLDGLTLVLRYENGELVQAITRGREGIIGEDVTHTVKVFRNVPLTVPIKKPFEVRGEGVISWKNFNEINSGLTEPYSHPRMLASGSTRKLDANEVKNRHLRLYAFELISDEINLHDKEEQLKFLASNGFDVVPYTRICGPSTIDDIQVEVDKFNPKDYEFPADGLIMEYADIDYGKSLGATGHHENRLIALKWSDDLYDTKFLGVEMATTRTGMVSLTAILEPITIDGTVVTRAYLHNFDIFNSFNLGIGDTVKVYKANMIIPQIAENVTQSNTYRLPMFCPCCGEPLTVITSSGGTNFLYCNNSECPSRLVQKFVHFCEKTRMNIDGLSERTLEKFIGYGWVHSFGDLYELEKHKDEIVNTDGFGEKSYQRLQASIEKSRKCTLDKFIAGLGIPTVGRHAGKIISKHFNGDWNTFEQAIIDGYDFTELPDFGQIMHTNIYTWYADKNEAKLWRPLLEKIEFIKENHTMNVNNNTVFLGKTIVATGKLENYTRDEIQAKIISLGATPASSVTRKTDYLIVGEKAGSKLQKALNLGIRTLTEDEFEDILTANN